MEPKLEPAILTLRVTHIMKSSFWWDRPEDTLQQAQCL